MQANQTLIEQFHITPILPVDLHHFAWQNSKKTSWFLIIIIYTHIANKSGHKYNVKVRKSFKYEWIFHLTFLCSTDSHHPGIICLLFLQMGQAVQEDDVKWCPFVITQTGKESTQPKVKGSGNPSGCGSQTRPERGRQSQKLQWWDPKESQEAATPGEVDGKGESHESWRRPVLYRKWIKIEPNKWNSNIYNNNRQNNLHLLFEMSCKPSTLTCLHKSTHEQ